MAYLSVFINNSNKNPVNVNRDTRPVPPGLGIEKWVKEHMVFWYDMSKPVDTYAENFNDWTKFTGSKYTVTNKSVNITDFGAVNNASVYIAKSKKFNGITVTVDGLSDGQEIAWGYDDNPLVRMPENGTYTLEPINSVTGNIGFRSINIAGACNITITQLPSGQSVPTNEILKADPYLQDHSANNRPLKLNNFLFSAMSGVGGYTLNAKSYRNRSNIMVGTFGDYSIEITAKVADILGIVWTKNGVGDSNSVAVGETLTRPAFTVTVEGMPDDLKWGLYESGGADKGNGTFEIPAYTYTNNTGAVKTKFIGITFSQNTFDNADIKFTFQPLYPNALVADGVDDYGQVQNLSQGVKMLFMSFNIFSINRFIYDQRYDEAEPFLFAINNADSSIAYNYRNSNGTTYIDGTLNESAVCQELLNKRHTIAIVNDNVTPSKSKAPLFFRNTAGDNAANMAFYNSIGFDAVPTKETDGFTEQELTGYVLENLITQ